MNIENTQRPKSKEGYPEASINRGESRTRLLVGVDSELLAEGQLDDGLFSTRPEQGCQADDENRCVCDEDPDHPAILRDNPREIESESCALSLVASQIRCICVSGRAHEY